MRLGLSGNFFLFCSCDSEFETGKPEGGKGERRMVFPFVYMSGSADLACFH